jgi:MYXO-CTERM domain-containing protein
MNERVVFLKRPPGFIFHLLAAITQVRFVIESLPMKIPAILAASVLFSVVFASAQAAVVIEFSDEAGGTRVNVSGSLNTAGLSFGSPLSFEEMNLKESELWFTGAPGNYRFASHFLPVPVWHSQDANGFAYSDFSGGDFGVNSFSIALPSDYVSGAELTTRFLIDGLALTTLNPQSGVIMTLGNGDTINVSVVPEPAASAFLMGAGGLVLVIARRRRMQSHTRARR